MVQRVKVLAPSLTARRTHVMEEEQQLLPALLTLHKCDLNQKKRGHQRGGALLSFQSRQEADGVCVSGQQGLHSKTLS